MELLWPRKYERESVRIYYLDNNVLLTPTVVSESPAVSHDCRAWRACGAGHPGR